MRTGGGKFIGWKVLAVRIGRLMGGLFAPWGGSCWGGIHGAVGGVPKGEGHIEGIHNDVSLAPFLLLSWSMY